MKALSVRQPWAWMIVHGWKNVVLWIFTGTAILPAVVSGESLIVVCDICEGKGGWMACLGHCDANGKHAPVEASEGGGK
jgi:hypothetical protein